MQEFGKLAMDNEDIDMTAVAQLFVAETGIAVLQLHVGEDGHVTGNLTVAENAGEVEPLSGGREGGQAAPDRMGVLGRHWLRCSVLGFAVL